MTQSFSIGDEVEVIGPRFGHSIFSNQDSGKKFQITEMWKPEGTEVLYSSDNAYAWYPASSLRLVDDFVREGDYVEVIKDCKDKDHVYKVIRTDDSDFPIQVDQHGGWWSRKSLRKLTQNEIAKHLAPTKEELDRIEAQFKLDRRLSAIESRLNELGPSHAELLGDVENIAERVGDIGRQQKEMWERHEINRRRLDKAEDKISVLEGERPEVIDSEPFWITISKGEKNYQSRLDPPGALEWTKKVLDSMKET